MMSSRHKNLSLTRCSTCRSSLKLKAGRSLSNENEIELQCAKCDSTYSFRNGYLNLLPPKIRAEICTKVILTQKIKNIPQVGALTKNEQNLVKGILASKNMAKQYFRNVVHPMDASWSARSYERFEDIFIAQYLNKLLQSTKVTFIDAGSGPGRYLLLLGSKISPNSCKELKRSPITAELYKYDAVYDKNLRYIIGIDYSEEMISYSTRMLRKYGMGDYLYERIFPIVGIVQDFYLDKKLLDSTHKVVVCTFQTLGNQENTHLQVELLKSMERLASPRGTIIVSVFNKKLFKDFGLKTFYGREVRKTVGAIIHSKEDEENSILRTTKGVYSKWFSKNDLEVLFRKAQMTDCKIMDEKLLRPIIGYEQYLKREDQIRNVFPRAILGLAEINHEDNSQRLNH